MFIGGLLLLQLTRAFISHLDNLMAGAITAYISPLIEYGMTFPVSHDAPPDG